MSIKYILCWIGKIIVGTIIILVISILGGMIATGISAFISYMLTTKIVIIVLSLIVIILFMLSAAIIGNGIFRKYGVCKYFK